MKPLIRLRHQPIFSRLVPLFIDNLTFIVMTAAYVCHRFQDYESCFTLYTNCMFV